MKIEMKTTTNTAKKMYKVFAANHNGDVETTSTKLNIITGENRIDVDMTVDRKTLKGAYNVFIKAVEQAVADGALDAKAAEFAYFADDINDINFDGKDSVTFADNNCDFAYGIDDNSNCDLGFYFWFFVKNDTNEVNPDDYAANPDAFGISVNAEIEPDTTHEADNNTGLKEETQMTNETVLTVETKRTKRDSINLKLNGSRISLRNLEDQVENSSYFSVINQYGKEYSCYPATTYGYFGESPEGYTIHFNTLGELIEHYAVDNIIRTAATLVARVKKLLGELPKDPNEGDPTLARYITSATAKKLGSTSWAIRSTDFNRAEKALEIYKSALAEHANEYDFAIELAPKVIGTGDLIPVYYAAELDGSEEDDDCDEVFDLVPNISELSDIELCDELIDPPELPTAKPRTLRDSLNRAIKQCIRNRIGYLKSHNSKMEKYEYELLCLLQGARRELKIA